MREHRHPSLTCYKKHGCRCRPCTALNTEAKALWRWRKAHRNGAPYEGPKDAVRRPPGREAARLGDDELMRLRRHVGLL